MKDTFYRYSWKFEECHGYGQYKLTDQSGTGCCTNNETEIDGWLTSGVKECGTYLFDCPNEYVNPCPYLLKDREERQCCTTDENESITWKENVVYDAGNEIDNVYDFRQGLASKGNIRRIKRETSKQVNCFFLLLAKPRFQLSMREDKSILSRRA